MTDTTKPPSVDRYLSERFEWAAPGDQQEDAYLVRFCDKDCREQIWTGPDAADQAWKSWNRYAPAFNIYVFRLARLRDLSPPADRDVATLGRIAPSDVLREAVETGCAWLLDEYSAQGVADGNDLHSPMKAPQI